MEDIEVDLKTDPTSPILAIIEAEVEEEVPTLTATTEVDMITGKTKGMTADPIIGITETINKIEVAGTTTIDKDLNLDIMTETDLNPKTEESSLTKALEERVLDPPPDLSIKTKLDVETADNMPQTMPQTALNFLATLIATIKQYKRTKHNLNTQS